MSRAAVVERVTETYQGWIRHLFECERCQTSEVCRVGAPLKWAWKQARR